MTLAWLISCIVCLVGLMVAYLVFSVIFWRVHYSIEQVHQLQYQFNSFNSFNFQNLIKPIDLLIQNYPELKPVSDYIQRFDLLFKTNLKEVGTIINTVSIYNNHYDLKFTKENLEKIGQVFNTLNQMTEFSRKFSIDATEYQKNLAKLIIHFRTMVDSIWLFLHQHIIGSYDNNILKKCVNQISHHLIKLNEQSSKMDSKKIMTIADQLAGEIVNLQRIIKCLYSLELKAKYLRIVHDQIRFYADSAENFKKLNYSNSQILEIKNTIEDGKIILEKIKSNLHVFQFKEAHELNKYLFEKLVQLKKQISADFNAFGIVNENIQSLNEQIDAFEQNFEKAAESLQVIEKNFAENEKINQLIQQVRNKINEAQSRIMAIQSHKSNLQQHYSERLKDLVFIIDNIIECQDIMETLVKTTTSLMEEIKTNIQEVNNLKLLFAQIRVYITKENLILENGCQQLFEEWEQKINDKMFLLDKDYAEFASQLDIFLPQAHAALKKIMREVVLQANFKQIAAACIAYVNKYINEHNSIYTKQKGFEELFCEAKYEKIIKKSIKIIGVIKQSAYENNLTLA